VRAFTEEERAVTRTNKIILAIVAVAALTTYIKYPAWQLEEAHRNSGAEASCSLKKLDGVQWATCKYGAGGSIWLKQGNAWLAANSEAQIRAVRLATLPNRGGAALYSDAKASVQVPAAIAARL
jgi:hypothetical protein